MANLMTLAGRFFFVILGVACSISVSAQIIQSNGTGGGDWNSPATWVGGIIPDFSNSGQISIRNGDIVNIPSGYSVSVDQMIIYGGGIVNVLSGGTMDVVNGKNRDLNIVDNGASFGELHVFGRLEFRHGVTVGESGSSPAGTLTSKTTKIENGGVYNHKFTTYLGTLISPEWMDGSTIEFTTVTSASSIPSNLNQNYYNFVWNCPAQSNVLSFAGNLKTVRGDLEIVANGGPNRLYIFGGTTGNTLTIGGDLVLSGTASVIFSTGSGNTLAVGGDFIHTSTGTSVFGILQSFTVNIDGDISISNAEMRMANSGITTLNLMGDISFGPGGSLGIGTGGRVNVNFSGNTVINGSNFSGAFYYYVTSGSVLDLSTNYLSGSEFTLRSGGTLELGAYNGAGTNDAGALQSNTTFGNIRVSPANRYYESGSTIIYNGTQAQATGNGLISNSGIDIVFDNPVSVTLTSSLTARSVAIEQGSFIAGHPVYVYGDWTVNGGGLYVTGTQPTFFNGVGSISGTGTKSFRNLTINSTGDVVFPSDDLTITGNLVVLTGGSIDTNLGNVGFTGGNAQTISVQGAEFNDITVNKSSGTVALSSALNLHGRLTIQSGTTFYSNGNLTLLSTAAVPTNDGSIGPLSGGGTIAGNVNIQRFISAKGNINRYISSPITALPVSQLQDDFSVTGPFTGSSFPCTGCTNNAASIKWYNETKVNFAAGNRFVGFPTTSNAETFVVGRGYAAYMWEDISFTLDMTGTINSGDVPLPVTFSTSTPPMPNADGFNIVGNPYPSAIAWDNGSGWIRNNISPTVYVNDAGTARQYNYLDQSGDLPGGIIAMGQAFYVITTGSDPDLTVRENAKVDGKTGAFYRERPVSPSEQLIVSIEGNGVKANAFLKINPEATAGYDQLFDAVRMPPDLLSVALRDDSGYELVMHTVSDPADLKEVPVVVDMSAPGDYTFTFSQVGFQSASEFYLLDKFTGESFPVTSGAKYTFAVSSAASLSDRFVLTRNPQAEQAIEEIVNVFPNPFDNTLTVQFGSSKDAQVEIIDLRGQVMTKTTFNREIEIATDHLSAGVYLARVKTDNGMVVRKVVKK